MKMLRRLIYTALMTFIWALPVTIIVNQMFKWRGAVADRITELLFLPFLFSAAGMMFWIYFNFDEEREYSRFALASIGIITFFSALVAFPAVS
ncbi:hypothetical protein QEH52_20165 [Coraliomargarita sp. SDUM461003]|uniref:Uncharacterized protein n=1 Tax=Thalassobacterium maritimum TaxID=3041265 RepID=A0ABU1B2A7_9BACT|nr:hypothetical protein [Coraliomargarita sp. SDUM461003]MDQ8209844.1 hypothetical protein [Coraliomargarita sp. SDUM461003]